MRYEILHYIIRLSIALIIGCGFLYLFKRSVIHFFGEEIFVITIIVSAILLVIYEVIIKLRKKRNE